ncbi:MAG: acyl-CoA dehydrogenase, partial [Verrucomicrobiae bacterium]|nr:acyl-CoA dehydrogenase [Verrucomicrobiae bacterium]
IAEGARDLAVAYAGVRRQFGRQIGSFQAIKHHCANMAIGVEMVSAQLDMAAIAVRDGREDAAFQTAALARLAPRVALQNARLCIQIHGGIGFSAEADVQLFLKQAHLLRNYLGATDFLSLPSPMFPLAKVPA